MGEETECVKCIKCHRCVGACDCTGGPQTEQECTCYESEHGHQPGCVFNRRPPAVLPPYEAERRPSPTPDRGPGR